MDHVVETATFNLVLAMLKEFVRRYFVVKPLTNELVLRASEIKVLGDRLLEGSKDPELTRRRLSSADATSIALAEELGCSS